ncbi:MAG TPA: zinc-dependent alcohol dehydrogenase family protein [Rhodopila sp.]|uniref:zinc-dependent alcohol dehydrogenase family protein n=1 Tax=Rhodopila sp. TaxID=2480087 RepID=UPI002B683CF7|nr:zinc-dependent alcohol dehydrogenase family protein [Rhodopila sp.]HVY15365.1 zinc-dependent alcohol dehydrogenase family protein [Rhodopila sp.]
MKMKAAVLRVQGKPRPYAVSLPLEIETVDLDPPGPGEVLYKIIGAGLCHSDLSTIENLRPRKLPTIPGHEAAGIVEEVGPGVTSLKPGDHVVSMFVTSCSDCRYCNGGRPNLCQSANASRNNGTLLSGARRLSLNGEPINHYSGLSVFAQYAVVAQNALIKIPDDVPLEDATIFGCAVVTGVGAVLNTAQVPPGGQMAVVGLGGVGMNALMGGVVAGAERIVAVDLNADKLKLARELGATDTFLAGNADAVEEIRNATDGGLDYVIETAGSIPAMNLAYAITARGGMVVSAGLPASTAQFSYLHGAMVTEEKSIRGSYMGSCVPKRDIPRFIGLYRRGRLPVAKLRSGFVGFDGINEGFDRLSDGAVLRQVLQPHA